MLTPVDTGGCGHGGRRSAGLGVAALEPGRGRRRTGGCDLGGGGGALGRGLGTAGSRTRGQTTAGGRTRGQTTAVRVTEKKK
jgi:hypothetical protein